MATIWRVECPDCTEGPYTCRCGVKRGRLRASVSKAHGQWNDMKHPTPAQEGYLHMLYDSPLRCAFLTLDDARAWFAGWGTRFAKVGWTLWEVTPNWPSVHVLGKQVLYIRHDTDHRVGHSPAVLN